MKSTIITFYLFFLVGSLYTLTAQFPDDYTPYQSILPPETPVLPAYGASIIDNSVPNSIQITRITQVYDYVDANGNPQVWYPTHEYSKTQVWNADQTLYKIRSWKIYDAQTYQEIQDIDGSAMYPCYWSNTNPDLIWSFNENGTIKKHIISTNTTQIVGTVTNAAGNTYDYVKLGPGEGNIDKNDRYVALVGKDGLDLDVIIYDLQNSQSVYIKKFVNCWQNNNDGFPYYIDWVSMSQSGDYVVIMWNHNTTSQDSPYIENGQSHYGVEVYRSDNMQYLHRLINYGNHGDLGYDAEGNEVLVQFYGVQQNGLYMYKLDGSGAVTILQNPDFGVDGHVSCRNINRPGWAYITHSDAAQSGQIIAVKLDNTETVEYFGHHFSSNTSYEQSPMAVVSPNGDLICFKSDFGTGPNTNPSVVYSFIANLNTPASIDENKYSEIQLYPNPVENYIQVYTNKNIKAIDIYNVTGQLIKKIKTLDAQSTTIDVSNIASGLYTLKFMLEHQIIIKKIWIK